MTWLTWIADLHPTLYWRSINSNLKCLFLEQLQISDPSCSLRVLSLCGLLNSTTKFSKNNIVLIMRCFLEIPEKIISLQPHQLESNWVYSKGLDSIFLFLYWFDYKADFIY